MKQLVQFFVNLPWTIIGTLNAIISLPIRVEIVPGRLTVIIWVKSIRFIPKRFNGWTCGHAILVKTNVLHDDDVTAERIKSHELVHVEQFDKFWGIFPFIYLAEHLRHGYHGNRFELEAYNKMQKARIKNNLPLRR